MKERPDVGVYVKDLSAFVVNNADDMDRIMTLGNKNSESIEYMGWSPTAVSSCRLLHQILEGSLFASFSSFFHWHENHVHFFSGLFSKISY